MASLAEDISFGTGQSVEFVEKQLAKNTRSSLSALGAGWYAEDGVTELTIEEQHRELLRMFDGITEDWEQRPAAQLGRAVRELRDELMKPVERFANWLSVRLSR